MRATAQDPEAARLMGINVNNTISLTFMLGGMLAGAAGLVYALYEANIWYFQGFQAGLIAFTAAVMGGIGNVRGAVLGGLIIGIVQQLSDYRLGPQWTEAVDLRLPDPGDGPASARPARRGDAGGRMSELKAQLQEWRDAIARRMPAAPRLASADAGRASGSLLGDRVHDRAAVAVFSTASGFLNATIIALAYVVMALGLNIVVGFAGLLDLGYVAFYAFGAYAVGWFGSDFFFAAHVNVLSSASRRRASASTSTSS